MVREDVLARVLQEWALIARDRPRLRVLSLGFTRGLWGDPSLEDSLARLTGYSRFLEAYHVIAHSLRSDRPLTTIQIATNFWAHPTNGYTRLDSLIRMFHLGLQLSRLHRFDLVQSQDPLFTGTIGHMLARMFGIPHNTCVYGANPYDPHWVRESAITRLGSTLARAVLRNADGIQVDGSATLRALVSAGIPAERIVLKPVIPSDLAEFWVATPDAALRASLGDGGRFDRLLLWVGRAVPQKNARMLVKIAERVSAVFPTARVICVGDGWQRQELERETKRQGLSDVLLWLGARPRGEIVRLMATSDLFVLPSRYEGFARVLMEAAAAGLPIVTTNVSGADDAVCDGLSGYIVPIGDLDSFVTRIGDLLRDDDRRRRMGREGRRHMTAITAAYGAPVSQIRIWERLCDLRPGKLPRDHGLESIDSPTRRPWSEE